jgi:hypothetical protein
MVELVPFSVYIIRYRRAAWVYARLSAFFVLEEVVVE